VSVSQSNIKQRKLFQIPLSTRPSIASSSPKTRIAVTSRPMSWSATQSTTSPRPALATPSGLSTRVKTLCPPLKLSLADATATTGATIAARTPAIAAVAAGVARATCAVATVAAADALVPVVARLVGDAGRICYYGCFTFRCALHFSR
jgi:hypothetical protein